MWGKIKPIHLICFSGNVWDTNSGFPWNNSLPGNLAQIKHGSMDIYPGCSTVQVEEHQEMPVKFSVHPQISQLARIMVLLHFFFLQPDLCSGNSLCTCSKSCGLGMRYWKCLDCLDRAYIRHPNHSCFVESLPSQLFAHKFWFTHITPTDCTGFVSLKCSHIQHRHLY